MSQISVLHGPERENRGPWDEAVTKEIMEECLWAEESLKFEY